MRNPAALQELKGIKLDSPGAELISVAAISWSKYGDCKLHIAHVDLFFILGECSGDVNLGNV